MIISAVDAARSILKYCNSTLAVTMLAIAYGESGLDKDNEGDSPQSLRNLGYTLEVQKNYMAWNCPISGKTTNDTAGCSIGLLQINIVPNHDVVMKLSGISFDTYNAGYKFPIPINQNDACLLVTWLKNSDNNARAAKAIYDRQGLEAWSIYKSGTYKNYLSAATNAVNTVLSEQQIPKETPMPIPTPSEVKPFIFTFGGFLYVIAIGGATTAILYKILKKK